MEVEKKLQEFWLEILHKLFIEDLKIRLILKTVSSYMKIK